MRLGTAMRGQASFAREGNSGKVLFICCGTENEAVTFGRVENSIFGAVIHRVVNGMHRIYLRLHLANAVAVRFGISVHDTAFHRACKITRKGGKLVGLVYSLPKVGEGRSHKKAFVTRRKLNRHIVAGCAFSVGAPLSDVLHLQHVEIVTRIFDISADPGDKLLPVCVYAKSLFGNAKFSIHKKLRSAASVGMVLFSGCSAASVFSMYSTIAAISGTIISAAFFTSSSAFSTAHP